MKIRLQFIALAAAMIGSATSFQPIGPNSKRPVTKKESTVADAPPKAKKPKKEKVTPEAIELADMLKEKENGSKKLLIAQTAPSVRVGLPEEFGLQPGEVTPGQMVAALKELGFDLVLDTNTAADLTIMEEGTELLHRIKARAEEDGTLSLENPKALEEPLPMFTSCCPGWMAFVEKSEPELAPFISTCKSPHMMYGALVKEYSKQLFDQPAENIYFTSVMPCVRKRGESDRAAFEHDGVREVDNVVTVKDIGLMLRNKGINPADLEPMEFDSPFQADGEGSGAGQLFGATGGVMEAAVRTVYEIVTGEALPGIELDAVRGLDGVKAATLPLIGENKKGLPIELRIAVCSGLGNAKKLIKQMRNGEAQYDFVEVMACPGGCINGGGQPKGDKDAIDKRLEYTYELDRKLPRRKSHENPTVQAMYEKLVGEAGGHKAHKLFHVKPVYGGFE